jgi:hypothetical protein
MRRKTTQQRQRDVDVWAAGIVSVELVVHENEDSDSRVVGRKVLGVIAGGMDRLKVDTLVGRELTIEISGPQVLAEKRGVWEHVSPKVARGRLSGLPIGARPKAALG